MSAAGSPEPVRVDDRFLLVGTAEDARAVLTRPDDFTLPFDVARQPIRVRRTGSDPRASKDTPPLPTEAVARGRSVFISELGSLSVGSSPETLDTLELLRRPVARSTTVALVPDTDDGTRDRIADAVLAWIDALAPIISADRPPRRWSGARREERRRRRDLVGLLRESGVDEPATVATALAAGVQVPIAAGAWCLTLLAADASLQARLREDPSVGLPFVWEVLRLYPPTWLIARITTRPVRIGTTQVRAFTPVVVSPVALGRLSSLVPGPSAGHDPLDVADPSRWLGGTTRPGSWLPFGAGPHACPGRNLGLAQLASLLLWAAGLDLEPVGTVQVNADRGLSPSPSTIRARRAPLDS